MARRRESRTLAEVHPLPWPEAVTVDGTDALFVSFGTVPMPQFVDVRIFADKVDADGTPTGQLHGGMRPERPRRHAPASRPVGAKSESGRRSPRGVRRLTIW